MLKKTLGILFSSICAVALGGDVGNGGDGVVMENGEVYLLDLVERGDHQNPYFNSEAQAKTKDVERIETALRDFADMPSVMLAQKIAEIEQVEPVIATLIRMALKAYAWHIVGYELKNAEDENTPFNGPLVQLALRDGSSILIHDKYWRKLNAAHRVVLILHKILHSLIRPEEVKLPGSPETFFVQRSARAREINAYFFSPDWDKREYEDLVRVVRRLLPLSFGNEVIVEEDKSAIYMQPRFLLEQRYWDRAAYRHVYTKDKNELFESCMDEYMYSPSARRYDISVYLVFSKALVGMDTYVSPVGLRDYMSWQMSSEKKGESATNLFSLTTKDSEISWRISGMHEEWMRNTIRIKKSHSMNPFKERTLEQYQNDCKSLVRVFLEKIGE